MKKIFASLFVFTFLVAGTGVASAAVSSHPIWSEDNTRIVGYIADADWDRAQAEAYQRQNDPNRLVVAAGVTVTNGVLQDTCPVWFFKFQCVAPKGWWVL